MRKIKLTLLSFTILTLFSCNQKLYKALNELKNMPSPDYSYVIEPKFTESQESTELRLKELFFAEEAKIGTFKIHGYDKETKEQINERFWLQTVLLNTQNLSDYRNEKTTIELGKEVAKYATKQISNIAEYNKIQITFVRQWNDGSVKQEKRTVYLTIPEFDKTEF